MASKAFLVVEDDLGVRTLLEAILRSAGFESVAVCDGMEAIDCLRRRVFAGIILDLMMPRANGFEVLEFLEGERPDMVSRTIVITAASDATLKHFDISSIHALIRKPFDVTDLLDHINRIASSAEVSSGMLRRITPAPPR